MADKPLAEVDDVTKRFAGGGQPAIADLSLRIAPGRVTGLVGPDGAGKTTLLRLLAALLLPDAGRVTVCGFDTATGVSGIRQAVSYMPQRFGLYEDLSVRENLELYADLRGVVGSERQRAFSRLLAFTKLAPFTERLAGKLSGGMKQKLGLACALINTPQLLLLDEPSAGVDPISRRELWRMVYELVDQGIGVVWSTAYLDEAERCASVVLLSQGRALYEGPPKKLTDRVAGRSFLVQNLGKGRRKFLADVLKRVKSSTASSKAAAFESSWRRPVHRPIRGPWALTRRSWCRRRRVLRTPSSTCWGADPKVNRHWPKPPRSARSGRRRWSKHAT